MTGEFDDGVRRTILIIDDEAGFRQAMEAFLTEYGYNVILADGGQEGLAKLRQLLPQMVFLDMNMPGMNGIQVLTEIRKNPDFKTIPVVMLTAQGDTNLIMQAQDLNATDFMTKPFEVKEILALIKQFIA